MALIRGWLYTISANLRSCGIYSRAVTIFANSRSVQCLFNGGYYLKCGIYSRAVTIFANSRSVQCLFNGGYYLKCGIYLRKYGTQIFP